MASDSLSRLGVWLRRRTFKSGAYRIQGPSVVSRQRYSCAPGRLGFSSSEFHVAPSVSTVTDSLALTHHGRLEFPPFGFLVSMDSGIGTTAAATSMPSGRGSASPTETC